MSAITEFPSGQLVKVVGNVVDCVLCNTALAVPIVAPTPLCDDHLNGVHCFRGSALLSFDLYDHVRSTQISIDKENASMV